MGQCLSVQEVVNWQRAKIHRMAAAATHRQGGPVMPSFSKKRYVTLKVRLTNGDVYALHVHLAATFSEVGSRIRTECGMQPHVFAKGRRYYPWMVAQYRGVWMPIRHGSNVGSVGQKMVKYATTEDIIKFPHGTWTPHWCSPNIFD